MTFTYPSHTTKGCVPLSSDVKENKLYQDLAPEEISRMSSYPTPDRNVTFALKLPFHVSWGTARTIDRHIIVLYPKIERLCYHGILFCDRSSYCFGGSFIISRKHHNSYAHVVKFIYSLAAFFFYNICNSYNSEKFIIFCK